MNVQCEDCDKFFQAQRVRKCPYCKSEHNRDYIEYMLMILEQKKKLKGVQ
jgi:RNA polymerase subunit RPABC4/transcription elongation factor Spt4